MIASLSRINPFALSGSEAKRAFDEATAALAIQGPDFSRKAVGKVLGAYRTPDLFDPTAFVDLAVEGLQHFPAVVLARMADPATGIISTSKFLPSIAEMAAWCRSDRAEIQRALDELTKRVEMAADAERRRRLDELRRHWREQWPDLRPRYMARFNALPMIQTNVRDAFNVIDSRCDAEAMDLLLRLAEQGEIDQHTSLFGAMKQVYDIINSKSTNITRAA